MHGGFVWHSVKKKIRIYKEYADRYSNVDLWGYCDDDH